MRTATATRRHEILDAALAVFLERGVPGASIAEIGRRAGASTGSIYHLFEGKEAIAAACYLEALADYQRGLLEELERRPGAREGISAGVAHHLCWIAEHPRQARFLFEGRDARGHARHELRAQNRRFFAAVGRWVDGHVRDGRLRALPAPVFYALWIGPGQELARHSLAGEGEPDPSAWAGVLADAACAALTGGDHEQDV
jgi:AcrR family transcriptional regulator